MNRFLWSTFFLLVAIDISLAFLSWDEIRSSIGWVKAIPQQTNFKLRHLIQYTPQALLLCFCLENSVKNLKSRLILAGCIMTFIGMLTEFIQIFIPTRIATLSDVGWNLTAVLIGVGGYYCFKKITSAA